LLLRADRGERVEDNHETERRSPAKLFRHARLRRP